MSTEVSVNFDMSELTVKLGKFKDRAYNMSDVNAQIAQIILLKVDDKFQDQGPGWPQLADSTIRRRRASSSPKMLQDTGDLINSLMPESGVDFAGVFTNKAYAKYHLEGDGVPKRDFFDIDFEDVLFQASAIVTEAIGRAR